MENKHIIDMEAMEIALAKLDNSLLDKCIGWMIDGVMPTNDHLVCWLIQAKQYRNLELEYIK